MVDEARLTGHGFTLASPREARDRGGQCGSSIIPDGYAVMQALIARGIIGDFRAPATLRFGFSPLFLRFVDVWDAVEVLARIMADGALARAPEYAVVHKVT